MSGGMVLLITLMASIRWEGSARWGRLAHDDFGTRNKVKLIRHEYTPQRIFDEPPERAASCKIQHLIKSCMPPGRSPCFPQ